MKKYLIPGLFMISLNSIHVAAQNKKIEIENEYCSYADVFTPNNDSINDTWFFKWKQIPDSVSMNIYNRWGEKLFEANQQSFVWDGTNKKGKKAENGIYPFSAFLFYKNEKKVINGMITLLR